MFCLTRARRVWNVCWVPLFSIQTVTSGSSACLSDEPVEWTTAQGAVLPAELIRSVLCLLGPQELHLLVASRLEVALLSPFFDGKCIEETWENIS